MFHTPPKTNMTIAGTSTMNESMYFLLNMAMFQCHVGFQECNPAAHWHPVRGPHPRYDAKRRAIAWKESPCHPMTHSLVDIRVLKFEE